MKRRTSVSIDGDVLRMGKEAAEGLGVSFSAFLEDAIRLRVDGGGLSLRGVVGLGSEVLEYRPGKVCDGCGERNRDCVC